MYDPRLLALFCLEVPTPSAECTTGSVQPGRARGFATLARTAPWRGLHRMTCASMPGSASFACAAASTASSASAALQLWEDGGDAIDACTYAERSAVEVAAAAAVEGPSAGAVAALEQLRRVPRITQAEARGTALDLACEGVRFPFAAPEEVLLSQQNNKADGAAEAGARTVHRSGFFQSIREYAAVAFADARAGDERGMREGLGDGGADAMEALSLEGGEWHTHSDADSAAQETDLGSIADVSEIVMAEAEAKDAMMIQEKWEPRRHQLKDESRYQRYLEVWLPGGASWCGRDARAACAGRAAYWRRCCADATSVWAPVNSRSGAGVRPVW